jgi:hypothetical protein
VKISSDSTPHVRILCTTVGEVSVLCSQKMTNKGTAGRMIVWHYLKGSFLFSTGVLARISLRLDVRHYDLDYLRDMEVTLVQSSMRSDSNFERLFFRSCAAPARLFSRLLSFNAEHISEPSFGHIKGR